MGRVAGVYPVYPQLEAETAPAKIAETAH
jgi:hypothetical protein